MNRTRTLIVLALTICSALLLWACGGDGGGDEDPADVLTALEDTDQQIDSGNLSIKLTASASGDQEGDFELNASGPFQGGGGKFPSFDIAGDFSASGSGQDFSADGGLVSTGDAAYLEYQDTAYQLPQEAFNQISTLVSSAQEQQETAGDECQQALKDQGLGVSSLFSDLSNEGTEDIEGAETTHITGGLDFDKVTEFAQASADTPACAGGQDQGQLEQAIQQIGTASDSIDGLEIGLYVGNDDDLIHGADVSFGFSDAGNEGDFDLEFRIGDVNQPQTVAAPQNVQPLDTLLQNFGIDSSTLNQALGQLGAASGAAGGGAGAGGQLPRAGGPPTAPSSGDTQAYLQCIQQAQGAAALQECQALLP